MNLLPLLPLLLLLGFPASSHASLITFNYQGVVNEILNGPVQIGDLFSGSYAFESSVPDTWADLVGYYPESDALWGWYVQQGIPGTSITLTLGELTGTAPLRRIQTHTTSATENYLVDSDPFFPSVYVNFVMLLPPLSEDRLPSDALPTDPVDLFNRLPRSIFTGVIFPPGGEGVSFRGSLTSLTLGSLTPIPEPATFLLLASGLALLGVWRRRKQHAI